MKEVMKECYLNHSIKIEREVVPGFFDEYEGFELYYISLDGRSYDCAFYEEQAYDKVEFLKGRLDQQIELA